MGTTCIYCGKKIEKRHQVIWVGKDEDREKLECCSAACYNDTRSFMDWDQKSRIKAYVVIAVCVVLNLFVIGQAWQVWWQYLPILVIGVCLWKWPLVFTHYHTYHKYGIVQTLKYIQWAGIVIAIIGFSFSIWNVLLL